MPDKDSIALLRCPHCVIDGKGVLSGLDGIDWLSCTDCGRQYPIIEDIPMMLPEEGDKWRNVPLDKLPEAASLAASESK